MNRAKKLRKVALAILGGLLAVIVGGLVFVKCAYGGGEPYRDVNTAPRLPDRALETLVELEFPPGNVTSSPDGRIFFNTHPFVQAHRFAQDFVFELVDGEPRPYPDRASQRDLQNTFGMTVDRQNRLWLISPASLERERTRLIAIDLATGRRVVDHWFEPGVARFSQDLRVTADGRTAILADTGAFYFTPGSIVVVDLENWSARAVLADHPSTQPQDWVIATDHGPHRIGYGLLTFAVGVDGIAISRDGAWLYYATMTHDTLYRVRMAHLLDRSLTDAALAGRVERVGPKPLSDGIEVAPHGEILITDIEHGAIVGVQPDGRLQTIVRRDAIVWADGVDVMEDGTVLFTDSAIPSYLDPVLRPPARERLVAGRPYRIYRFRLRDSATAP